MLRLNYTGGNITVVSGTTESIPWTTPAIYDTHQLWDQGNPAAIDFSNAPTMAYWLTWSMEAGYDDTEIGTLWLDNDPAQIVDQTVGDRGGGSVIWAQTGFIYRIENGQVLRLSVVNTAANDTVIQGDADDRLFLSVHGIPGTESRS